MIRVYCEDGAKCDRLEELAKKEVIKLMTFPYEQRHRQKWWGKATPSKVTADSDQVVASDSFRVSEAESEMYTRIRRIVGGDNEFDVRHIDSAYKSGCKWFFTPDKGDVWGKREELQALLGIRFLLTSEIAVFDQYIEKGDS